MGGLSDKRPLSLTVVGWFLIVFSPFALLTALRMRSDPALTRIAEQSSLPVSVQVAFAIIGAMIGLLCGYGILKGFNWARFVYVGWTLLTLILASITLQLTFLVILSALLFGVIVLFLFRRAANAWFTGGAHRSLATDQEAIPRKAMEIEVRSIRRFDTREKFDLRTYTPQNEKFSLPLIASIGVVGERGAEDFFFEICSLKWLEEEVKRKTVVSGQYTLIVERYSYEAIEAFLKDRLEDAAASLKRVNGKAPAWEHIAATQFSDWAYWEFLEHFLFREGERLLQRRIDHPANR